MLWLVRTVLLLTLTSSALAKKSDYWWLFPNFDENGSNNHENSATNVSHDNLRNSTDGEAATLGSIVESVFNLPTNVDVDIEYEDNLNENEGSGSSVFPVEDLKRDNKTQSVTTSENISDQDTKDLDWAVDRDWASKQNQSDTTTFTNDDALERDNVTETEQQKLEKADLSVDLMKAEKDKVVHIDGDAHPSSKLEEEQTNDEDDTFSGDDELQDEKAEIDELAQIFKEQDEAVHEDGDVHPSSKIELEDIKLETEDVEDLDFPPDEKDEPVHENGDVHPSSKFELEENNYNDEEVEDSGTVEDINSTKSDVVPEEVDSSSSEESQENNEENPMKENSEFLERSKNDEDADFELSMEDVLVKDEEKEAENAIKPTQDDEAENVDDEDDTKSIKNKELSPIDSDYEDITLHWVNEEILKTDTSTVRDKNLDEDLTADIEDTSSVVPMAPIFETPLCSFETRPFDLAVLPVNSISGMHGTDVSLLCQLVPRDESEKIPYFRLTWLFEKEGCQKNATDKNACTSVLTSKNFESPDSPYTLSYDLTNLNHTIHTGVYICDAEIYGCQTQNLNATQSSQALYLRVYTKPNYGLHIGVISSVCVLLLAILAGLVSYARRVQRKSKSRYQELLSSADIQYYPSKVLELPNSVYNTTTTGFVRMSASTFSSKSSFTSNEEDA